MDVGELMAWRRWASLLVTLIIVLLLGVLSGETLADSRSVRDPNDTGGRFDVVLLAHSHSGGDKLVHRLRMAARWSNRTLRGDNVIYIWFSTDSDSYAERRIVIDRRRGDLVAGMENYDESSDGAGVGYVGRAAVSRPTNRAVQVRFPKTFLGDDVSSYKWSATTYFQNNKSKTCNHSCRDQAPEFGEKRARITHDL